MKIADMSPPSAIEVLPETDTSTFTIPDRLTIQNIAKRRAASGKLVAGVAAIADINAFKGRTQHLHKAKARQWDHRFTTEAKIRKGSSLKNAARYLKTPGLISLGGGLPSSEYFPFQEITAEVPAAGRFSVRDLEQGRGEVLRAGKHDLAEGKSHFDISTALQYGQGHGSAQLLRWIIEHTELVHDPPYRDWSCTMSVGSTSSLEMIFRMFCNAGDWILTEQFSFPAAIETARPMGIRAAAVGMDECGMLATALDDVLSNWDETVRRGPKPFVVYTVPTGQNPTGATQSAQRRRDIYAVAQKHDLLIVEDEPYYFLQMQPYVPSGPTAAEEVPPPSSHQEFLSSLVPSFLSMDVDGRVVRLDSFSKVIAPGMRVGWITAPEQICQRYQTHADLSTQAPSGASQLILFKLLEEQWGHEGYLDWLIHIRLEYSARRNTILKACEEYLPAGIVRWAPPMAGMFLWLEVDWKKHPDVSRKSMEEIEDLIFHNIIEHRTLLMKGSWFCAEEGVVEEKMFFRATYAAAQEDQIQEAIKRFGDALRSSFGTGSSS